MSKVRILSPRPENSNRRIRGGFNFLFGTVDSNGKLEFTKVRTFHSIYHKM